MPSRRTSVVLLFVLLWAVAAAPASAATAVGALPAAMPATFADSPFAPRPVRDAGDGSPTIHGQLARVVAAARAGTLGGDKRSPAYAGLLLAPSAGGEAVAVSLTLDGTAGEPALQALIARGGRVANRSGAVVEAYLPPAALSDLLSLPGIASASPILRPIPLGSVRQVPVPTTGIGVLGEGVAIHGADQWQAAGVTGSGVKVGIIDGGFVGLTSRIGRELPTSVHARCYHEVGLFSSTLRSCEGFTDHGTAVAETVADMAPGASLYVADPLSEQDILSTVAWMTSNGVRVINVSLGFAFEGPGDGTGAAGSIYGAVNAAVKGGALWVNAAGNSGEDGWVGPWQDQDSNALLEFAPGDESNTIKLVGGDSIIATLRWNDTWGRSANDYDLYLFGPTGSFPVASSEDPQTGRGDPVESLGFTASTSGTYRFVIRRDSGAPVSRLQLLVLTSADVALQHRTVEDTLPSPADSNSPGMVSVGAVNLDTTSSIEPFSSQGPTVDGRIKPDLVAVDCTRTVTINPFCGTSVSTPYVAGAAALVLSARPTLTAAALATWLRNRATPLGSPSPNPTFGWGRLTLGPAPAPPAPAALRFTSQPAVAVAGVAFHPAVSVQVVDQDGLPLTSGSGSTTPVTLSVADGAAVTVECAGGLTQAATAGIATFDGCSVSGATAGLVLRATSSGLSAASSVAFDVVEAGLAPAPLMTLGASASAIVWGSAVTLTAHVGADPAAPLAGTLAGRAIRFESSADRATWRGVGSATTNSAGSATLAYRPATNNYYRAVLAAAPDLGAATSSAVRVTVRQLAVLRPSPAGSPRIADRGSATTFTTLVRPARADVPPGPVVFEIYRTVGADRRLVSSVRVSPDTAGAASLAMTFTSTGTWSVRAQASPTRLNANSLWTPFTVYVVR